MCISHVEFSLSRRKERRGKNQEREKEFHAPNSYFNHLLIQCISWPDKLQSLVTDVQHLLDPMRVHERRRLAGLFPLSNNAVITLVNARESYSRG